MKKVVVIGAGNVAHHLGVSIKNAGLDILQVYSRTIESARSLGSKLNADFISDISQISKKADLYLIAVKDAHIKTIVTKLNQVNGVIVHTSGSIAMNELSNSGKNAIGVLYPLQTFSKTVELCHSIYPICVEANTAETEKMLCGLAGKIVGVKNVYLLNSNQRKAVHVAAVFACNFSNHMHVIAEKLLEKEDMDYGLLSTLIQETSEKLLKNKPSASQTGPAKRNDQEVINDHLQFLANDPGSMELYQMITNSIIENHPK